MGKVIKSDNFKSGLERYSITPFLADNCTKRVIGLKHNLFIGYRSLKIMLDIHKIPCHHAKIIFKQIAINMIKVTNILIISIIILVVGLLSRFEVQGC